MKAINDSQRLKFVLAHGLPSTFLIPGKFSYFSGEGFKTQLEAIDAAIKYVKGL